MNVLSLFDGISCGRVALDRAGINVKNYYASEIDKYATKISEANYPDIIRLGDVTKWKEWDIDWSGIDLVTAGFPCQSWSLAGKQMGDRDPRGALFWTTLDVIANVLKYNPSAKFLMENVRMKKEFEEYITHHTEQSLGYVEKTLINSALVSAQNRNRFYWTNFKVNQPGDKGILLKDIIEDEIIDVYPELRNDIKGGLINSEQNLKGESQTLDRALKNGKNSEQKANSLTACSYKGMGTNGMTNVLIKCGAMRGRYIVDGKRQDHKMITAGLTKQRLELRKDDKTNTLTTVQKDNVVVYRPCELLDNPTKGGHVANATDIRGHQSIKRVYSPDGKAPTLTTMGGGHREPKVLVARATVQKNAEHCYDGKCPTLTASMGMGGGYVPLLADEKIAEIFKGKYINAEERVLYRKLTPLECERLQTLPDNFTLVLDENGKQLVSNTQRYKAIGNGWTVDVIAHILSFIK